MPVRLVYAVADPADSSHCLSITLDATVGVAADLIHWNLSNLKPEQGVVNSSLLDIPLGAAIVEAESGGQSDS